MVIVTPATGCAGWPIRTAAELKYGISDGNQNQKSMTYVWMANSYGLPSISLPAGYVVLEGQRGEESVPKRRRSGTFLLD